MASNAQKRAGAAVPVDPIPLDKEFSFTGPDKAGQCVGVFSAFNTSVTLQAYGDVKTCRSAFVAARDACRRYERLFSRTLPHSDVARINASTGEWVPIAFETYDLLKESLRYCRESGGVFDVTMGSAVRLWDFHKGVVPDEQQLQEALAHVNWRAVQLGRQQVEGAVEDDPRIPCFARLTDPQASVDVGGTAKGWIADALGELLRAHGIERYLINLGGNVLAGEVKPDGSPWRIGLQDPRHKREENVSVIGAVPVTNASVVTSGVYERTFTRDGRTYHHILDPKTGYPVETDLAAATIVAERSMDAEGYSTTMLALGHDKAKEFMRTHARIKSLYLITPDAQINCISRG